MLKCIQITICEHLYSQYQPFIPINVILTKLLIQVSVHITIKTFNFIKPIKYYTIIKIK